MTAMPLVDLLFRAACTLLWCAGVLMVAWGIR